MFLECLERRRKVLACLHKCLEMLLLWTRKKAILKEYGLKIRIKIFKKLSKNLGDTILMRALG
jgi:phosphopantetheinyl transferase